MAISIFKLVGSIMVDNAGANKSIDDTGKKADSLSDKFVSGVGTVAKWGAAVATAAGGAATALFGVATSAADSLDEIQKGAQQLGISYENYQKLSYACDRSGTSIDSLSKGMKQITNVMTGLVGPTSMVPDVMKSLGVETEDASGKMRDAEDVMFDTLLALADMEDETTRTAYATKIFGNAGQDLAPLLNQGSDGIKDLMENAEALGLVLSDEAVDSGAAYKDSLDDIKDSFQALVTSAGAELFPVIREIFAYVQDHMPDISEFIHNAITKAREFVEFVYPYLLLVKDAIVWLFERLSEFIQSDEVQGFLGWLGDTIQYLVDKFVTEWWPAISDFLGGVWEIIQNIIQWIKDNVVPFVQDTLWPALVAIFDWLKTTISDLYTKFTTEWWPKISEILGWLWEKIEGIVAWLRDTALPWIVNTLWPKIQDVATWLWDTIKNIYNWFKENVLPVLKNLYDRIMEKVPEVQDAFSKFFTAVWDFWEAIKPAIETLIDLIKTYLWPAIQMIIESPLLETWMDWIVRCINAISDAITNAGKVLAIFRGDWSTAWEGMKNLVGGVVSAMLTTFNPLYQLIKGIINMIKWIAGEEEVSGTVKTVDPSSSASIAFGHATAKYEEKSKDYEEQVETLDLSGRVNKMAKGGTVSSPGMALVGEAGPELLQMPRNAQVTPLNDNNNAFASMNNKLDELISIMKEYGQMGIYLDGDTLVGGISAQMDAALGVNARRAGRGV